MPVARQLASHKANWHASGMPSLESRQWLANWRATGESTSQLRVLTYFSAYKKGKLDILRRGWKNTTGGTSRALLGGLKSLKNLGISWESSGELGEIWVFLICGCIFLPILHHSSMHSFIVLGFVLFAFMCN